MTKNEKLLLEQSKRANEVRKLLIQFAEMQTYAAFDKIPFDYRSMTAMQLVFLNVAIDATVDVFENKLKEAKSTMACLEQMLKDARLGRWG